MIRPLALLLFAAVTLPASADVVVLTNGSRFEGIVREEGGRVRIETDLGMVELPRDLVREIERAPAKLEEYRERTTALREDDVESHYELGRWAKANELETVARHEFEAVLAFDPDHASARAQLGYQLLDGRWMSREEAMQARGFVLEDGAWISREEIELRTAAEEERRRQETLAAEENERERRRARQDATVAERLGALEQENARLQYELARQSSGTVFTGGFAATYPAQPLFRTRTVAPWLAGAWFDQRGDLVVAARDARSKLVWTSNSRVIHAEDDGHAVLVSPQTGQSIHYPNGTASGEPDRVLTPIR